MPLFEMGIMSFSVLPRLRPSGIDDETRIAMAANIVHFSRGNASIYEHGPRIKCGRGQENYNEGSAVFTDEHNPVASAHAQFNQPVSGLRDPKCQVSIAQAARCFNDCKLLRSLLCPALYHV